MKTLTTLIIVALTLATSLFAKSNDKFYTVTDNGTFQYNYWEEAGINNPKAGDKAVTLRTFFLEVERNNLLPLGITCNEFEKLSTEEKQAMLTGSQSDIIALRNTAAIPAETVKATESPEEIIVATAIEEEVKVPIKMKEAIDLNLPWIVRAATKPGTETNIPFEVGEVLIP